MLARQSEPIEPAKIKTQIRRARLSEIGYTNEVPRYYTDNITDEIMDDPYRFNDNDAQITDYNIILQHERNYGSQTPFFQDKSATIVRVRHTELNGCIQEYMTILDNLDRCFTQLESYLALHNTELPAAAPAAAAAAATVPSVLTDDEKIKRIAIIKELKQEIIDLLLLFATQVKSAIQNDGQILDIVCLYLIQRRLLSGSIQI